MTVLDTSVVVDLLADEGVVDDAASLLQRPASPAAPDSLVFEVLSVLRRQVHRDAIAPERAQAAVDDLGDLRIELFPSLRLRQRAWDLRHNLAAADALFVALAEQLGEPLATEDRGLAAAARKHAGVETIELGG